MFADVQYVTNELAKQLPQNPTTDPIYFEVDEGKVIMPEILLGHTADHENNVEDGVDDEEEDLNQSKTRFDWRNSLTRVLLNILADKKNAATKDFTVNKKKLWSDVSKELAKRVNNPPSSVQYRLNESIIRPLQCNTG